MRSYDTGPNKAHELGSERTPAEFVANMVAVFEEVRRVLRPGGICALNIGDSYATGNTGYGAAGGSYESERKQWTEGPARARVSIPPGLKPKDLMLIPERLAIALQDAGWWVRSRIAWVKKAPMPESVTDRPTSAWEHVWLLAKSETYFWDAEAVREESSPTSAGNRRAFRGNGSYTNGNSHNNSAVRPNEIPGNDGNPAGRNMRNYIQTDGPMMRLRPDLSPEQQAYVLERLAAHARLGLAR